MSLYGNSIYLGSTPDPLKDFVYMVNGEVGANGVDYNDSYVYNSNGDTCLALLKSGTLILSHKGTLDVFLVGGGGGGRSYGLGTNGGETSITELDLSAAGGVSVGGSGGSGGGAAGTNTYTAGDGGSNGANGGLNHAATSSAPGVGQGRTTRAFSEETGNLFAGGGGGGGGQDSYGGAGGAGGGGAGTAKETSPAGDGTANTGGGGGSGYINIGAGGGYTTTSLSTVVTVSSYTVTIGAGGSGGAASGLWRAGGNGGSGIVLLRSNKHVTTNYLITYNINTPPGQTVTNIPSDTSKAKDAIYTIPSNYPVCTGGYSFDYWLGSDDIHYAPGDTYSSNAHISFTAIWTNGATCFNFANLNFNDIIFP